ncbi:Eukaryotic translation initiation factor 4G, putative isoform 2 [Hibiscus syriacus]|uniref:Eukaryotic translation initiation factor 4G, putative isoform 2 n=1 Tax=Hibiscus syriacus TaxID=106335 RepID=A0A6A2YAE7_HIBSY|nr:Eukaryotic translation initiation factor 4G, putative isoform 2 [Hibiscus syriacus]
MPMHMPLPMGNAPQVQQHVFVPGLQAHQLPPQGMMHQGQGSGFSPPIGGQLPPHLGSLGMGIAPQYPQQQGGKFGVPRKTTTVKITHPDTHEELRLDKRTDTHADGGASGPSSQIAVNTQGPRFNYPISEGHQNISFMNSAAAHGSVPGLVQVTVKPTIVSVGERLWIPRCQVACLLLKRLGPSNLQFQLVRLAHHKLNETWMPVRGALYNSQNLELTATSEESMPVIASNDGKKDNLSGFNPIKDNQKKANQSTSTSSLASDTAEHGMPSGCAVSKTSGRQKERLKFNLSSDVSGTGSSVDSFNMVRHAKTDGSSMLDEQQKHEISVIKGEEGKTLLEEQLTDNSTLEIPSHSVPLKSKELKSNKGSASKATATSNVPTSGTSKYERVPDSRDGSPSRVIGTTDVEVLDPSEPTSKYEMEGVQVPSSKERHVLNLNRTRSNTTRGKKKRKEILQKADAAGTTSDLYMAYKGPEEKKETVTRSEKISQNKAEPDDWEDAADISTAKLGTSGNGERARGGLVNREKGESRNIAKYSRDFLLKFAEKCTDLPPGFEIASDIVDVLMVTNANASHFVDRDSYSGSGRIMDRQFSGARQDCRASGMVDDDRWIRQPGSFGPGRDLRFDLSYGAAVGFRPCQGGNFGVLRYPRGQAPLAYVGGILAGPMQPMGPQGGMPRNSLDSERWLRTANYQQKGFIPSPQTPLQMMHKAERKYEVGIVSGAEESKQRQLKAILNKLTPQNFEKLFEQRRERTRRSKQVEEEGEAKQSEEEREEKRIKARRRMLGNIRLIGELYKKKMLTERIMHECIKKLLGEYENPDEEDVEALCKLMRGKLKDLKRLRKCTEMLHKSDKHKPVGINAAARRAPMDFGPRGSMLSSPGSQMGNYRAMPNQARGFGAQDSRMDDRQEVLLEGCHLGGPSGISSTPLTDASPASGDSRRVATSLNGFNSKSERATYGSREDLIPRYGPERSAVPTAYAYLNSQERGMNFFNWGPDHIFDRSPTASSARGQRPSSTQSVPSEKCWSEEHLRDMSMSTIKEFYSARDEKEVALCIKDLNSPSFHPSMIALLSHDGVLSQVQLVKGTLEDAILDVYYDGGEEPGRLRETGLAGDILGSILGVIKTEKGESVFNEARDSCNLRLEDFRPPDPYKSRLLETFL